MSEIASEDTEQGGFGEGRKAISIWQSTIFHASTPPYLEGDWAVRGSSITLRVRVGRKAPVERLFVSLAPDGEQQVLPARRGPDREHYDCCWWEVRVRLTAPVQSYCFQIGTAEGGYWLSAAGLSRTVPHDRALFHLVTSAPPVEWIRTSVFYQIFPDRFADGDPGNNVRAGGHKVDGYPALVRRWGDLPNRHSGGREFYGGDLQGVTQRLDHLHQTLGVSAIYLNPIFTAPSSHKYDVADYREVDPHFGGNTALVELRRALDERSMRLVVDVVPNHCGRENSWFRAARHNPAAETADFFTFHRRPDRYECWMGYDSLPKLNYTSHRLREWMYAGSDSVLRSWLRPPFRLDGWRLDVANMLGRQGSVQLGHKILRGIRRAVKEENPEAYLLGENFYDPTSSLQGDELDATMHYRGFMMPLYHWLIGQDYARLGGEAWGDPHPLDSAHLAEQWSAYRSALPYQISLQQFNLLDSHDTPRLLTMVSGDQSKALAALACQFGYPGTPCVYYGDEIGMTGGRDPDNRRTMDWQSEGWDTGWLTVWQKLIRLRRASPALARGATTVLAAEGDTVAFLRDSPEDRVLVVAHRGPKALRQIPVAAAAVPDGASWTEVLTGETSLVTAGRLPVGSAGGQMWRERRP